MSKEGFMNWCGNQSGRVKDYGDETVCEFDNGYITLEENGDVRGRRGNGTFSGHLNIVGKEKLVVRQDTITFSGLGGDLVKY